MIKINPNNNDVFVAEGHPTYDMYVLRGGVGTTWERLQFDVGTGGLYAFAINPVNNDVWASNGKEIKVLKGGVGTNWEVRGAAQGLANPCRGGIVVNPNNGDVWRLRSVREVQVLRAGIGTNWESAGDISSWIYGVIIDPRTDDVIITHNDVLKIMRNGVLSNGWSTMSRSGSVYQSRELCLNNNNGVIWIAGKSMHYYRGGGISNIIKCI